MSENQSAASREGLALVILHALQFHEKNPELSVERQFEDGVFALIFWFGEASFIKSKVLKRVNLALCQRLLWLLWLLRQGSGCSFSSSAVMGTLRAAPC